MSDKEDHLGGTRPLQDVFNVGEEYYGKVAPYLHLPFRMILEERSIPKDNLLKIILLLLKHASLSDRVFHPYNGEHSEGKGCWLHLHRFK